MSLGYRTYLNEQKIEELLCLLVLKDERWPTVAINKKN